MPPATHAIDSGDTAWLLISAALVMLMTPALGFFYGGLVRRKNVLSTIMHSLFILALISVPVGAVGLLACVRARHRSGAHRRPEWVGTQRRRPAHRMPTTRATVPHLAFMVFQMMFAVITPALITGAFAERKRFKAFVLFTLLGRRSSTHPIAHWVWGTGGWLRTLGALDFAGGTVVHIIVRRLGARRGAHGGPAQWVWRTEPWSPTT